MATSHKPAKSSADPANGSLSAKVSAPKTQPSLSPVTDFVQPDGQLLHLTPDRILTLQRTIGNAAVQRLLQTQNTPDRTHVSVDQRFLPQLQGQATVARDYETKGVEIKRGDIEAANKSNYWEQKVWGKFNTVYFGPVTDRFKKDKEERDAVLAVLWDQAPKKVKGTSSKSVTIPVRAGASGSKQLEYEFKFKASTDKSDTRPHLEIHFKTASAGTAGATGAVPSAGYADKDTIDLELEKPHPTLKDHLGKLSLSTVPADERVSVKYAIWQYFFNKVRTGEVDAKIPIAHKSKTVLYTLRFKKNGKVCDVEAERIGDASKKLAGGKAQLDPSRIHGFAANATDPATLLAWWNKRYPGATITLPGTPTIDDLKKEMAAKLSSDAGTTKWFKDNYTIHILNATDAETRAKTIHSFTTKQAANMKTFSADDLKLLEASLQTMGPKVLDLLKEVRMIRQENKLDKNGNPQDKQGGLALTKGSDKTVFIFDAVDMNDKSLFIGGKGGVEPMSAMTYAHELGHIVGFSNDIEKKFNKFVKTNKIKPMTWYANSKKTTETFPEAFALYQLDPEWLKSAVPKVYTWLDTLNTTGSPPP